MTRAFTLTLPLVVGVVACAPRSQGTPPPPVEVLDIVRRLAPNDTLVPELVSGLDSVAQQTLAEACRALAVWDESNDPNRHQWDVQRLALPHDPRPGPIGRIHPARGSSGNTMDALEEGRFVAKFWIEPEYRHPESRRPGYPKLGLPQGTSCLFVRKAANIERFEGLIVPAGDVSDPGPPRAVHIRYHAYGAGKDNARWQWDPEDDTGCSTCTSRGWCETTGVR